MQNGLLKILILKFSFKLQGIFISEGGPLHYKQIYVNFIKFPFKVLGSYNQDSGIQIG